jgi:uncharacterized protein (UPF0303 family)
MAEDFDKILKELEDQEKALQFTKFTNETALELGMQIVNKAIKEHLAITIDISRNHHQLFHYACEGTSLDFDEWIVKKSNFVYRCNISSFHVGTIIRQRNSTIEKEYLVSSLDYSGNGGAFPITIKDVGVVGALTISGLPQAMDHQTAVDSIKEYLATHNS